MLSCGMRLSSWDFLKWKDIEPYTDENGKVLCAKITLYNVKRKKVNKNDKFYFSFISPEAYNELNSWMEYRKLHGEVINKNSWVMRNLFETTKKNGNNLGEITNPLQLKSTAIKTMLERGAKSAKLFEPLEKNEKRREWKLAHGLRKYFKTMCENARMESIKVETLMDHDLKLGESYYKPNELVLRDEYLKAVPLLTIEGSKLSNQQLVEIESKYKEKYKELQKEIVLMKFSDVIEDMIEENPQGVITTEQQLQYFIENKPRRITDSDIELIKEMIRDKEITAYEEEPKEMTEFTDEVQSRYNYYKIFPDEYSHTEEFDQSTGNLIVKFDDESKEDLILPPLPNSPQKKYPIEKVVVSTSYIKAKKMAKKK